ncbi:MAG: hypothetical protein RIG63_28125 [Coleofasciculus chthonoplastes F3-SA18-01]|uniref:hypothetical protein n=1 Tax=Coleofasciculus chthonoplastes TaxID=64178 RepID=UPI0033031C7F
MDWSYSLMQAGRPYQDRLFPSSQFHHAIAGSISVNCIGRKGLSRGRPDPIEWIGVVH